MRAAYRYHRALQAGYSARMRPSAATCRATADGLGGGCRLPKSQSEWSRATWRGMVVEDERLVGILTERDVLRAVAAGRTSARWSRTA